MASPRSIALRQAELTEEIQEAIINLGGPPVPDPRFHRDRGVVFNRRLEAISQSLQAIDRDSGLIEELAARFSPEDYPELHEFLDKKTRQAKIGIRRFNPEA